MDMFRFRKIAGVVPHADQLGFRCQPAGRFDLIGHVMADRNRYRIAVLVRMDDFVRAAGRLENEREPVQDQKAFFLHAALSGRNFGVDDAASFSCWTCLVTMAEEMPSFWAISLMLSGSRLSISTILILVSEARAANKERLSRFTLNSMKTSTFCRIHHAVEHVINMQ